MKNKIAKIWGVGLIFTILASILISALPVSAGTLSLTKETDYPSTTDSVFITGSTLDMAVSADGNTVYVVTNNTTDTPNKSIFKSTNGGTTFSAITAPSTLVAALKIAVAPDDANVIVVTGNITGGATVGAWVSTNGGSTFSALVNAANVITDGTDTLATVNDIAIASLDGSTRYIAIAGVDATDGALFYFNLGSAAPTWSNAAGAAFTNETTSTSAYNAVAFSPNFPSDQILVAVSSNNSADGGIYLNVGSFNQKTWNVNVFDGYPKLIETVTTATQAWATNTAAVALDPQYLGGDDTTRISFVGYSATDNAIEDGGLWRMKDTSAKELTSSATAVNSVDWNGTVLVAGAYDSNNVYRSEDALATSPTVSTSRANKEIGLDQSAFNDRVVVEWAGTSVYGIKQGTGAAFSKSADNGKTWNDQSLMNTTTPTYMDIAVSNNTTEKYILVSDNATHISVFRKATAWQRVFMLSNTATDWIIRLAPTDPNVIYLADQGNTAVYYSKDGGLAQWTSRTSRYNIQDLAVQDVDIAYVAKTTGTTVSKTTNGGFTWATEKETTVAGGNIATIALIAADNIIVGSTTGYVAYSTDGSGSWTKIATALNAAGNTQVTASSLAANGYIYAATNAAASRVERWQVGQSGTTWKNMSAPTTTGYGYYGLALYGGVLYGLASDGTGNSELQRNIEPENSVPAASHWSTVASAGEIFNRTPSAIKLNTGSTKVWVVNTSLTNHEIYSYTDTLVSTTKIALAAPADKYVNPINPVNGYSQDISFSWTAPTTGSLEYQVRIYAADQTSILATGTRAAVETTTPNLLMGPNATSGNGTSVSYAPGTVYYWAVRVSSPAYSVWSDKRSFTIQALEAPVPGILSPINGATIAAVNPAFSWDPITAATSYTFQLALIPDFSVPLVNVTTTAAGIRPTVKLDTGMTYFWRVRAQAPVQGEWSATANFIVANPPEATAPPVVITQLPPPTIVIPAAPPATTITIPPAPAPQQIAPGYIWAIIIIGAVLVIAVIVLIVRTRRTV